MDSKQNNLEPNVAFYIHLFVCLRFKVLKTFLRCIKCIKLYLKNKELHTFFNKPKIVFLDFCILAVNFRAEMKLVVSFVQVLYLWFCIDLKAFAVMIGEVKLFISSIWKNQLLFIIEAKVLGKYSCIIVLKYFFKIIVVLGKKKEPFIFLLSKFEISSSTFCLRIRKWFSRMFL